MKNDIIAMWNMKKSILLIPLFLIGCATVKKTNTETELKTDSVGITNLNKWSESEKYTFEPFDPKQPIKFVNSKGEIKEYYNTIIKQVKEKAHEQKKNSVSKKAVFKEQKKETERDYTEVIETLANRLILLIIVLFVISKVLDYLKEKPSKI
jgi:isochorismate synthase EntC